MKKLLVMLMILTLAVGMIACSNDKADENSPTEVTILGTIKSEIGDEFEAALEIYNASQSDYLVKVVPMDGQNAFEKMTSLYASNNAPTIMVMGQEMADFKDKLLDISQAEFSKLAYAGTQDNATYDGRVLGMPVTVEGFGLLYNKAVLDEAVGGDFDPTTIKTRDDLENLFIQIESIGKKAIHLSPMDWSLGAHLSNKMFTTQSDTHEGRVAFLEGVKDGSVDLTSNPGFNNWVDTFDLLMKYNSNIESPLSADYDQGSVALGSGEVGFWFMGNWAYGPLVGVDPEGTFGIMPVPVSNEVDAYGNSQISVGVPMYFVIDQEQSSAEEQAGAIDFLNWIVTSNEGQDYYVNKMNFIPVFDKFSQEPSDYMSKTIMEYTAAGQTLEWVNMLYPADAWPAMGASMQKYLDSKIDRQGLAEEFMAYWTQQ